MVNDASDAPKVSLDPVIHPSIRLRICAALSAAARVEFGTVQRSTGVTASNLSKNVTTLTEAGYVTSTRALEDSRRIWLELTPAGRSAYTAHVAALRAIVGDDT